MLYIPDQCANVLIRHALAGDQEEMVCTIGVSTAGSPTAAALATGLDTALRATGSLYASAANLFVDWSYVGVKVTLRSGADFFVAEAGTVVSGSASGETLPSNCAFLVRKNTARGGRRGKGRMYLPPFYTSEGNVSKLGVISSSQLSALNTVLATTLTNINARTEVDSAILLHAPTVSDPTPDADNITSLVAQSVIATQRKRLRH